VSTSDETAVLRAAARRAEDAGNLTGATRLVRVLPVDADRDRWLESLRAGRRALAAADPDALAAWLLQPAARWGLAGPRGERWLGLAADVLRAAGLPAAERQRGALARLEEDFAVVDAGLFDLGVLAGYLAATVGGPLLARVPFVQRWPDAAVSVWSVGAAVETNDGPTLRLRDERTERTVTVHHVPPGRPLLPGTLVYARVLPGSRGPCLALPPVPLGRLGARRTLRAVARSAPLDQRLRAVAAARLGDDQAASA
jgi:hypothetical protein